MKKSIFGMLLVMESQFMWGVTAVALHYYYALGETDWQAIAITAAITMLCGMIFRLWGHVSRRKYNVLSRGDSFIIVALTWALFSVFGALPFLLYPGLDISITDAYFETMSGFTTTGASVLNDIDSMPHGLLLWRSVMQWMGGLGIVVFSFALIPVSEMKNANIFQAETTGMSLDRLRPKIGATARRLLLIYLFLTTACACMYWAGPMNLFDAVNHSMTTIATGGYSTHGASLGYWHSSYVEYVATAFMIIASINFSLYYYMSIRRPKTLWRNEEMQSFICILVGVVAVFALLFRFGPVETQAPMVAVPTQGSDIFRASIFHVATTMSSTGFQGQYFDYVGWGVPFWMPTIFIMIIGGCAGSTAGGMKVMRVLLYMKSIVKEFKLHLHPRAVVAVKLNGVVIPDSRLRLAFVYLILYVLLVIVSVFLFALMGLDTDSAIGCSINALSNIGPATGAFGPANNFSAMPELGKWLMSFLMLVGRLEILTILFLFMPRAWKQ